MQQRQSEEELVPPGMNPSAVYIGLAVAEVVVWAVLSSSCVPGRFVDVHAVTLRGSPVYFRPTWMLWPEAMSWVYRSERVYLCCCHAAPLALVAGSFGWRFVAFVACWLYALLESSLSHWHRDLATCYTVAWFALSRDERWARAGVVAAVAHMMFSSGAAKLRIGGVRWPESLGTVLKKYMNAPWPFGPGWPRAARWMLRNPSLLRSFAIGTLGFEAGFPAALLLLPPSALFVACTGLHVGIMLFQSVGVGISFLAPNVVLYAYAFSGDVNTLSMSLVAPSVARFFIFGLAPRNFPVSPFALFAWSDDQWKTLHERYVEGRRKIAIGIRPPAVGDKFVQRFYSHTLGPALDAHTDNTTYDAWERCFGETLVFNTLLPDILDNLSSPSSESNKGLVEAIECWLRTQRPLVEIHSGKFLRHCAYVELHPDRDTVRHVIL